jgi:ribose 5-phosphate isomerase A
VDAIEQEKRAAAEAAADLVPAGALVGLGTGSTAAYLLPALRERDLQLTCVATSVQTAQAARALGLVVVEFSEIDRLDIAIDGADQIAPDGWVIKGGGGAHTREKIVAAAAERYVIIASSNKRVERLTPPVPVELLGYGAGATLKALAPVSLRGIPPSPDGGLIADHHGATGDPRALAAWLERIPGVVGHGLFEPELIDDVLIARDGGIEHFRPADGGRLL